MQSNDEKILAKYKKTLLKKKGVEIDMTPEKNNDEEKDQEDSELQFEDKEEKPEQEM